MKQFFTGMERYQFTEILSLLGFIVIVTVLVIMNPSQGSFKVTQIPSTDSIQAYALAMPAEGWSPLTVYFSAFGSNSLDGSIVKYEWDLDGNGRYDTNASDEGGYTQYTYKKNGIYNITLRITDEAGNSATDSLQVVVRYPGSSSVDYWSVFDDTQVRRVDISLTSANWDLMWSDPEAKLTVPANANIFGEKMEDVGLRMRGQFSLRMSGDKKPWKLDMDYYIEGQEYHNLKQLFFLNNIGDSSLLQEKLAYETMQFAGIPSSFVCFVEIWIDFEDDNKPAQFWGVYTMVERVDKKFLANRFGRENDHGNLYKASHAIRGPMDLIYYGPEITDYPTQNGLYAYGKESNEIEADYSDVINLIYAIDGVSYDSPSEFAAALEQVFNVDTFLRYMAVINALGNWDSYPYTGNNFFLYNNPGTGRFEWIPWDLTWGNDPNYRLFGINGPGLVERAPLFDRVFEVERFQTIYAGYLDLLGRYWLTESNISTLAKKYHEMISPLLSQGEGDKMFYGETAMFHPNSFIGSWEMFGEFAGLRSEMIQDVLASDQWKNEFFTRESMNP